MRAVLYCTKKEDKIALVNAWKSRYTQIHVRELIACAKKPDCYRTIANWKDDEL